MKPKDRPLPKQQRDYDKTFSAFETVVPDWQSRALTAEKQLSVIAKATNCTTDYQKPLAERVAQAVKSLEHFQERTRTAEAEVERLRRERDVFRAAFEELHATVKGECPFIINADSGGGEVLIQLIIAAEEILESGKS